MISSNIDEFLSINPSANAFVFGDFNIHHKDWLNYSGGADRSGELCCNFFIISNDLTQMVNFPIQSQTVILNPAFFDLFISSEASICSTMAFPPTMVFPPWEILIMLLSQFPLTFQAVIPDCDSLSCSSGFIYFF